MPRRAVVLGLVVGSLVAAGGCDQAGEGRVLSIAASGVVNGIVYFDADGSREPDGPDAPLGGVGIRLVALGTRDTVARVKSAANGAYEATAVPVGTYLVVVDTTTIGDSVRVVRVDTSEVSLGPDDTVVVQVGVGFPSVTTGELRGLAVGTKVFVSGVALTAPGAFGDTTMHLADTSGAIRATRVRQALLGVADSVRLRGMRGVRDGQPTLDDVTAFRVAATFAPAPTVVSTAVAAAAMSGTLDAGLAKVVNATIGSVQMVQGDAVLTVDDGSGPVTVVIDADTGINPAPYTAGATIDAIGVLIPTGSGGWLLKPRFQSDLVVK